MVFMTTMVRAGDGKVYDLGKFQFLPTHNHPRGSSCPSCIAVNAWTEEIKDV